MIVEGNRGYDLSTISYAEEKKRFSFWGWGGGVAPPPNGWKVREKKANTINMIFWKCYQNPLGQLLR